MKKIGLLVLITVLALGALGIGYAAWSQDLLINGSVSTGSFDPQLVSVSVDPDVNLVANVSVAADIGDPTHSFTVTITNGYPNFNTDVYFSIKDNGTVPAKVTGIAWVDPADVTVTNTGTILATSVIAANTTVDGGKLHIAFNDGAAKSSGVETFTVTISTVQQY